VCLRATLLERRVFWVRTENLLSEDKLTNSNFIEEWTLYILTLGLSAVQILSSPFPTEETAVAFDKANSAGFTRWQLIDAETSRLSFLEESVSRVYEDRKASLTPQAHAIFHPLMTRNRTSAASDFKKSSAPAACALPPHPRVPHLLLKQSAHVRVTKNDTRSVGEASSTKL
jgi:hypothetical protein